MRPATTVGGDAGPQDGESTAEVRGANSWKDDLVGSSEDRLSYPGRERPGPVKMALFGTHSYFTRVAPACARHMMSGSTQGRALRTGQGQ